MEADLKHKINALSATERDLLIAKLKLLLTEKNENALGVPKKLVGYLTTKNKISEKEILSELRVALPDYMVPSSVHILDEMPVLPNGKINRKALGKLKTNVSKASKSNTLEPKNEIASIEQQLIAIWEEVLNIRPIHKTDNFFEIGGDSILSIQIIAKARKLGIEITPNQIFDYQSIGELVNELSLDAKPPKADLEATLKSIWEEVLNVKPIHLNDNFFEIGGDSILSIQIIAKARKMGIELEPKDLFDYQTIEELIHTRSTSVKNQAPSEAMVVGEVPLTPIQHWFFDTHKNVPQHWNQGVVINGLPTLSKEQLSLVMESLIKKHDALRLSFTKRQNGWIGNVLPPESIASLEYVDLPLGDTKERNKYITNFLQDIQRQFDFSKGNLFKCLYFKNNTDSNTNCVLIGHHLVIDAVSWQLVLDDFKSAYDQAIQGLPIKTSSKTTSIKTWADHLNEWATSDYLRGQIEYWQEQTADLVQLPVDIDQEMPLLEKDIDTIELVLDQVVTRQLIAANTAYNTKTDDLLVTALVDCFLGWTKGRPLNISLERHGREIAETSFDLTNTVGWLTSYFPIKIAMADLDTGDRIKSVKEQLRQIPDGGMGYGVLKYLGKSFNDETIVASTPQVLFNFLGTRTTAVAGDSDVVTTPLGNGLRNPMSERYYLFEINAFISNGRLYFNWSYGTGVYRTETVEELVKDFKKSLMRIIEHCVATKNSVYTPSDFPDVELNQGDLDNLLSTLE